MTRPRGVASQCEPSIREGAMEDFDAHWRKYSSPSAAAKMIGRKWGIGRTTLTEWLQDEGRWPRATLAQVRQLKQLEEENDRLKKQLAELLERHQ